MTADLSVFRYHRSPARAPYDLKKAAGWGTFVRYIELHDDGFALRQVDEYANGYLSHYDRSHWDDQFGTLADFRFGEAWIKAWGTPDAITRSEFEEKWTAALGSPVACLKTEPPSPQPPWL